MEIFGENKKRSSYLKNARAIFLHGTVAHIYERQSAGDSEWWKTRLLSSPPFSRFFKIGAITKKVLEISYESYGSEFPNSFYKKSRCDPRPRFFEWEPNQTTVRLEWWKNKKRGKYSPKSRSPPPPRSPRPPRPPVKSQSNHPQRLYEPKWDYCRLKGLPTVQAGSAKKGAFFF